MEEWWRGEQGQQKVKEERTSHIVATLHAGFHYVNQIVYQCLYPSCDKVPVTHRSWMKIRHWKTYLPIRLEATWGSKHLWQNDMRWYYVPYKQAQADLDSWRFKWVFWGEKEDAMIFSSSKGWIGWPALKEGWDYRRSLCPQIIAYDKEVPCRTSLVLQTIREIG